MIHPHHPRAIGSVILWEGKWSPALVGRSVGYRSTETEARAALEAKAKEALSNG